MNKNYIDQCIEEALAEAKGNKQQATRILMARSVQDKLLEDGLFAHFREAATFYHVQRFVHKEDHKTASQGGGADNAIDDSAFSAMVAQLQTKMGRNANPFTPQATPQAASAAINKKDADPDHGNNLRVIAGAFKKSTT